MTDLDELVSIEWYDAAEHRDENINDIKSNGSSYYFVKRTSYGRLATIDDYGLVLITDQLDTGECELVAIPRPWLSPKCEKELYNVEIEKECDYE